ESVGRNQTPTKSQRISESGLRACSLRSGIDCSCSNRSVFCPTGDESPPHQRDYADGLFGLLANKWDKLRRSDVVARVPVLVPRVGVEVFLDDLLSAGESIATTHLNSRNYNKAVANKGRKL